MIIIGLLAVIYLAAPSQAQKYKVVVALNCGGSNEIKTDLVSYEKVDIE